MLGVALDEPDRADLLERTEGLIAAVALAGVLARGHDETRAVSRFGGATDELAQYLYAEVIDRLTVDVFGFMLATSVLDVLEPAACDEITGRSDSRALLADLARRNVLTESIDGGTAYRYHRLLHDFLRAELRRTRPERWRALHRAAAAYFERTNDEDRALRHWIDAGEIEEAWIRFRRRALPRFWGGAVTSVAQWTAILPKPNDAIDITRALDMALTLILTGDVEGALDWLHLVEAEIALGDADDDTLGRRAYIDYLLDFAQRRSPPRPPARRRTRDSCWPRPPGRGTSCARRSAMPSCRRCSAGRAAPGRRSPSTSRASTRCTSSTGSRSRACSRKPRCRKGC